MCGRRSVPWRPEKRSQLQAEGVICIDRRHIRLLDMDALVRDDAGSDKLQRAG